VKRDAHTLDAAVDRYERAIELRDAGNDDEAFAEIEAALADLEGIDDHVAAIARARFAISRSEIATRTRGSDEALALARDAVERARLVRRREPIVLASAYYMLGKAERPLRARRFGASSFERSFDLWEKLEGPGSRYTQDAARALATACITNAEWQRALPALDLLMDHAPSPAHLLRRAIAHDRLGFAQPARHDIENWIEEATTRPLDEQVHGHAVAARIFAGAGKRDTAAASLRRAYKIASTLPADPARTARLLAESAWRYAFVEEPPWFLAAEVLMRRAAALAWSPELADTAWRIASAWRFGVAEELVQPAFAVLDIEASLQVWDTETATYVERPNHQQFQLVVGGAPTTVERLANARWRDLCVQRVFSTFHAEQFAGHEPNFVAPIRTRSLRLPPEHVLDLLPSLRVPKWATTSTAMISSLGEIELSRVAELAILATRALPGGDAIAAVERALPSLGRDVAREMLAAPREISLQPAVQIPLIPES